MDEILAEIIDWCFNNNCHVTIDTHSESGGFYLTLQISFNKDNKLLRCKRMFYIGGGVFTKENYYGYSTDLAVRKFLNEVNSFRNSTQDNTEQHAVLNIAEVKKHED